MGRMAGGLTPTVGLLFRCLRVSVAAAKPTGRCSAQCPRVLRRSVWTPCTNLTSAAPSAKTVGGRTSTMGLPPTHLVVHPKFTACFVVHERCMRVCSNACPHVLTCAPRDRWAPGRQSRAFPLGAVLSLAGVSPVFYRQRQEALRGEIQFPE